MKTRILFIYFLCLTYLVILNSCSESDLDMETQLAEKAGIAQFSGTKIAGSLDNFLSNIAYTISLPNTNEFALHFNIDGSHIGLEGIIAGEMALEVNDVALTLDQKEALFRLSISLGEYFSLKEPAEKLGAASVMLIKATEYLAVAPEGHKITSRVINKKVINGRESSLNDDGTTCLDYGKTYTTWYDTSYGTIVIGNVAAGKNNGGSYNCMGRCGVGCHGTGGGAYTLDCLEHDVCSYREGASGGSSDPNCGDEYDHAIADFIFGTFICT